MIRQGKLKELFKYEKSSGRLIRKVRVNNMQPAGSLAGSLDKDGHRIIKIEGKNYTARQCVWIYHNGTRDLPHQIGVKNGIKHDDRIENLYPLVQHPAYMWWKD